MIYTSKILIVDDEELGRETLESLLIGEEYDLLMASDGFEAVKIALKMQPDLILLDVMMPGMDGFETCGKIRSNSKTSEIPIVLVTALDDDEAKITGIEAGADDFITKPYNRSELRARVKTITKLNRYRKIVNEREKVTWVVQNSDIGYLYINNEKKITFANYKAQSLLSIKEKKFELIDQTFMEIAKKIYRCEPQALWRAWPFDTEKTFNQTIPLYLIKPETQDEKEVWILVNTLRIPSKQEEQILVSLKDVTNEISAKRDILTFHSLIMHKLRTPFHGILGGLEYIKDEILQLQNEDLHEFVKITYDNGIRYHKTIESILQYLTTPDLSKYSVGCELSRLPYITKKIVDDLNIKSIQIANTSEFNSHRIKFDEDILEIIILKILENSKKFHPANDPEVNIEFSILNSDKLKIQISDNGLSLSPNQLSKIWNPYYQVDKHFTGEVLGTGLGLALVCSLILQAGGSYNAYNVESGTGLVIELIIPLEKLN